MVGIDCHIGSQITAIEPYLDALDRLLDLIEALEAEGIRIGHLDVGGGLGITYTDETPPDAGMLVARLLERIDARGHGHRELLFEPGRSLVGNAGVLVTQVLVLKPGEQKNFCIVDAAMNDLVRPAMYDAYMGIVPCTLRQTGAELRAWDVVGPVCESGDWLGRDRLLDVAAGRPPGRAVGRRLCDEHGQQLQQPAARRGGDGRWRAQPSSSASARACASCLPARS